VHLSGAVAVAFHRLKIADVRRETPDAVSIAFAVPLRLAPEYRFRPGQHLTLRMILGGAECRRSYSICTAPADGELRVAIKRVEGGSFSTWANEAARPGDEIDVMTPQGRFGIAAEAAPPGVYLAIAAGSGITPIMSLARAVLGAGAGRRFVLIYGNRNSRGIMFKDALDDLKDRCLERFTLHHVLSREQQELPLLNGRIGPEKIATLLRAAPAEQIDPAFLCGPGEFMDASRTTLVQLGIPSERIHVEYFSPDGQPVPPRKPVPRLPEEGASATAKLMLHGVEHVVPVLAGETIVDAGLRHGLDMPYSCRGGMCCTCRAMLVAGEVSMDLNYSLEPWELAAGYVLTCQSHPKTQRVVIDYDRV
jgi:ring-1,2-phenylacetyl-CoA epoxidase subunit PaaE